MAHHDMNTMMSTPEMVWELVKLPFIKAGKMIEDFVENNAHTRARVDAIAKVSKMTDEELKARGLTRAYAIQLILGRFD